MKVCIPLIAFFLTLIQSVKYTCVFGQMYANSNHYWTTKPQPQQILTPSTSRRKLITLSRPNLRIWLQTTDFNTMKTDDDGNNVTTQANLDFVKRAMEVAQSFFQSRLEVTTVANVKPPSTCFDYNPSSVDVSTGFATDLLIYALYIGNSSMSYGATGVSCKWVTGSSFPDTTLQIGRPTVGRIIFNTYTLVDQQTSLTNRLFAEVTATALHETMHILGFDQSLYTTYLDPADGNLYSSTTSSSVLHASRSGGANYILQTPYVTEWAQNFFNCSSLSGMILENEEGSSGVPGSHWQRLAMYDQLMTGTELGAQKSFSGLTFALLKDMGWYGVDDTFNDTVNYGYQRGCDFVTDGCYQSTTQQKYFCNPSSYSGVSACSTSFLGKATCSSEAAIMADGCGVFAEYHHCVDPDAVDDGYQAYTLQKYQVDSFCVKSTLSTVGIANQIRSRCYPYVCHAQNNSIEFSVGVYTVYCLSSEQGNQKTVSALDGYLQCPIFVDFCTQSRKICPNWCSKNGFCTRGICNCIQGFYGDDCSISSCSSSQFYDPSTTSCVSSCPSGTYENSNSKTCVACDSDCNECRDESSICTSCVTTGSDAQFYYDTDNICLSQCPSHTYQSTDYCYDCDTSVDCQTCTGSPTDCTSCLNDLFLSTPTIGSCGSTCSGTYSLYDQVNKKCVQSCPTNLFQDGSNCIYCPTGYKLSGANTCVNNCPASNYQDQVNKFCDDCDLSCQECDDQYAQNCTKCKTTGTSIYLYLKMCVESCPNGYYANDTSGVCQICTIGLFCATCEVNSLVVICKTCADGYYMQANDQCKTGCDQYFYKNSWNHSCDSCHADCGDCTSSYASSCINCRNGSYFLQNTTGGYCLSECPQEGYVTNSNQCSPCHETCLECTGLSSSDCHTCVQGLYLQSNTCRYVCSPGKFPNNETKICEECDSKCSFCFGLTADNCTQCSGSYVLSNFTCTTSCPSGYKNNANYNVCELTNSGFFS